MTEPIGLSCRAGICPVSETYASLLSPASFVVNQTRRNARRDEFHENCHEPIERERKRDWQKHVPAKAVHHGQHGSHVQTVTEPLPQTGLAFLVALHVD